jgi:hypothetical protein
LKGDGFILSYFSGISSNLIMERIIPTIKLGTPNAKINIFQLFYDKKAIIG